MSVRIVTDSACDLPQSAVEEYGIKVVPLYINVGNDSWLDGIDISRQEFYRRLPEWTTPPTTSAPSPGRFVETYEQLAQEGATAIISIHISANLSNTVNVAHLAAQGTASVPVTVIDGGQLTLTTGLMAVEAAKAAAAGAGVHEITDLLQEMGARSYTFAALETLEFIRRSGRMSRFAYGLGTWLKIKPVLKMHQGKPDMEKLRTSQRAVRRVIDLVSDLGPLEHLSVVHTDAPEAAEELRQRAAHLFPEGQPSFTVGVTPVIGSHIGPGVLGFAAVAARKE
jgi:DegV family protein with EDD domain